MKSLNIIFAIGATLLIAACSAENRPLQLQPPQPVQQEPPPPPPVIEPTIFGKAEVKQDGLVINIDKRVDVLFVMDDSYSMDVHQKNLIKNIDRFVDHLSATSKDIDFHIAVTTVHDSIRYLPDNSVVPRICKEAGKEDLLQWEDPGTLKALKSPDAVERFVGNGKGYKDVLKKTLLVGAQKFVANSTTDAKGVFTCAKGPENEDLFTPLMNVLSPTAPKLNEGFRREGAFMVVILVTDALDASGMNADQVYQYLQAATGDRVSGKRKLRVFAVAMNKGDKIGKDAKARNCVPDPSLGWNPKKSIIVPDHEVIKLARLTGDNPEDGESQVLSICSDYGATLANFGAKIVRDVIRDVTVPLPYIPDMNKSRPTVTIGETLLVEGQEWLYNEQTNEIVIFSSQVDWSRFKGQQITVHHEPVNPDAETTKPINEN